MTLLSVENLSVELGRRPVLHGLDLAVGPGEFVGLIGPNGAGKSTLFHLISGQLQPTRGTITLDGRQIQGLEPRVINRMGLARSFQITNIFPGHSVFENLRFGILRRYGLQYNFWRRVAQVRRITEETEQLLEELRLLKSRDVLAGELSYSEQRSLEIGMALASDPRVVLLDEPMAGMSREETDYTVGLIRQLTARRTLMIVEHDMDVVFSLSDRVSVLVYGQIIATGTPDEIRANRQVQEAYLGTEVSV